MNRLRLRSASSASYVFCNAAFNILATPRLYRQFVGTVGILRPKSGLE
jgi:hypothetical protein